MSFDPYHQWLGIPPEEQPADHYRLLGIRRFEQDANVIETSAERQLLLLKTRQNGPHGKLTQQLMNEVTSARLCLLDVRRKAEYDAQLRQRADSPTPAQSLDSQPRMSEPAGPMILTVEHDMPLPDEPWLDEPLPDEPWSDAAPGASWSSPLYPAAPLKARAKGSRDRSREWEGARRLSAGWRLVLGGAVTTALLSLALLGLSRLTGKGGSDNILADTDPVAKSDGEGNSSAPVRPPPAPPGAPPQPPQPPVPAGPGTTPGVADPPIVAARVPGPGSALQSVDLRDNEPYRPDPQPAGGPADGNRYGFSPGRHAAEEPNVSRVSQPVAGPDGPPIEFDLSAAIAAGGPENILLTDQLPTLDASWQLLLEDYSSPTGTSRFSVGVVEAAGHAVRWPVVDRAVAVPVEPGGASREPGGAEAALLAHLETGPAGLFVKFSASASPELIEQFSFCMLVFRKATAAHRIQLRTRERMPPVEIKFEKAKETIVLGGLPMVGMVARDRVLLEVLHVDTRGAAPPTAWQPTGVNQELTIPLDSQQECELRITLSDADGQYSLAVLPRYLSSDRRQQLVATEVRKDLARQQSRLTRSQKEMAGAQEDLLAIARKLDGLSLVTPSSNQEAAALRVQMAQLQQMAASATSKARRLSEVCPKLEQTIERTQRVLALVDQLSGGSGLHFRVLARGELGDLVLLQAASDQ